NTIPGYELVVGRDGLAILRQPSLALPSVNLQGRSIFQSRIKVNAELTCLVQEVAVDFELRGLPSGSPAVVELVVGRALTGFHLSNISFFWTAGPRARLRTSLYSVSMTRLTTPFGFHSTASEVVAGLDLSGKRMIVTGAASGIGVETARALAGAGAEVTLAVRDTEAGARVAAEIGAETGNR